MLHITLYLLAVNKCSSETPKSFHWVCVNVVVGGAVVVVIVVVVHVVVVALLLVSDHIILDLLSQ